MKKLAYISSKILFYGFTLLTLFVIIFSLLSFLEHTLGLNIPFVELQQHSSKQFTLVMIPLIHLGFGFPTGNTFKMLAMFLTLSFYIVYFYSLKDFFKIFILENTFTSKSINRLSTFYKLNFIPVIISFLGIFYTVFKRKEMYFDEEHLFLLLHLLIAFLMYFYLDLVKKGQVIQEENNLTI